MDDFEKAGLTLTPEQRRAIVRASVALNQTVAEVSRLLIQLMAAGEATTLKLSAFGLTTKDVPASPLPRTGSKGHWRDVVPRKK